MPNYRGLRALSIVVGLALVAVAAFLNISHAREIEKDWWSPICLAIGLLAVGSAVAVPVMQAAWRLGQRGMATIVCLGIIIGELFGLQLTAERLLAARQARIYATHSGNVPWQLAKDALDRAQSVADSECKSGRGKKCLDAEAELDRKREVLAGVEPPRSLSTLATLLRINSEYLDLASSLSFSTALLILGFVFLGFGHPRKPFPTVSGGGQPLPVPSAHPVIQSLRHARRPMTNGELAHAMGVTKAEASKRRREVASHLREERDGRHVRVSLH